MKYKCLFCDFEGTRGKLKNHVETVHNISYSNYVWKYVWKFEGEPKCPVCGKDLPIDRINRPRKYCSLSCVYRSENFRNNSRNHMLKLHQSEDFNSKMRKATSERNKKLWKEGRFDFKSKELHDLQLNPTFIYNKLKMRNVDLSKGAYVYLVKYEDKYKVGFTTQLEHRIHCLGHPEIIRLKFYEDSFEAIAFELKIHSDLKGYSHSDGSMNSTETYPLDLEDKLLSYFD